MELQEVVVVIVDDYATAVAPEGYKVKEVKEHGKKWQITYYLDKNWSVAKMVTKLSNVIRGGMVRHQVAEWICVETGNTTTFSGRIFVGSTYYKALYTFSYMGHDFAMVKPPSKSFGVLTIPSGHYVCTGDNQYETLKEFFERSPKFVDLDFIIANFEYEQLYKYVSPILLIA